MKRRLPKLAPWLAGVYLVWSLFVFLATHFFVGGWMLAREIFLYYIIWPVSALYEVGRSLCLGFDPDPVPSWFLTLSDYVDGAFYIIVGTIWVWFLGRVLSRVYAFKLLLWMLGGAFCGGLLVVLFTYGVAKLSVWSTPVAIISMGTLPIGLIVGGILGFRRGDSRE